MATIRHHLANLVSVPLTMISLSIKKILYPNNIFFTGLQRFSPGVVFDTDRKSKIFLGSRVSLHSRCRIASVNGGEIRIGRRTSFNVGCILVSRSSVRIGSKVSFGPNVMIYDHDHLMDGMHGTVGTGFKLGEIVIGDNCWIGAGSIILLDTHIGKNCVIAAGSVVKGDIPDNTVLVQKRVNTYKGVESLADSKSLNHHSGI